MLLKKFSESLASRYFQIRPYSQDTQLYLKIRVKIKLKSLRCRRLKYSDFTCSKAFETNSGVLPFVWLFYDLSKRCLCCWEGGEAAPPLLSAGTNAHCAAKRENSAGRAPAAQLDVADSSMRADSGAPKSTNSKTNKHPFISSPQITDNLLVILGVVLVAARILVLLPVFAVLAGSEQHHVLRVVDVV